MKGKLQDMVVADLIQLACQDRKTAQAMIRSNGQRGEFYVKNGNVVHAELGELSGEQAIYQLMNWERGDFDLVSDVEPPQISITRSWTSLLLEAARLADEASEEDKAQQPQTAGSGEAKRGNDKKFVEIIQEFSITSPESLLQQFSEKIEGHSLSYLAQVRGEGLYSYASFNVDVKPLMAQVNQFVKMIEMTTNKLGTGALQDDLLTSESAYLLIRFLGRDDYYLLVVADRSASNLGNLRHQARAYTERFITSLKLEGAIV